jgi:UDP-glucose 4-epimerase
MQILITGGAGYIGSHTIIDIIENTDWEVISLDNYSTSSEETYDRIERITGRKVKYHKVDLKNYNDILGVVSQYNNIKGIIHFAAHKWVGDSVENPLKYYENNLGGLVNILKVQKEKDIPNFIFSSSCSVYGNITELPVTENSKLNFPESPYAYTKQVGENIISDFIKANLHLKAISLRYFNPVGAHNSGLNGEIQPQANNLLPYITQTAIGRLEKFQVYGDDYDTKDGSCVRDYIHVSDIAHAHVMALEKLTSNNNVKNYDVINLGSGNGVSVFEIINAFEKENNIKLNYSVGPRREGDVESIYSNSAKAKSKLGWEPQFGIKEMVVSAWKWEQYLSENVDY